MVACKNAAVALLEGSMDAGRGFVRAGF